MSVRAGGADAARAADRAVVGAENAACPAPFVVRSDPMCRVSADCHEPAALAPSARRRGRRLRGRRASRPRAARGLVVLVAATLLVVVPATGAAQDDRLAAARARYDEARFAEAIEAFDAALARDVLPAEEVARALDRIAVSAFALGRARELDEALSRLVVVAPEHVFGPEVPPPVLDRFAALRATPPSLALELERTIVPGEPGRARSALRLRGEPRVAVRALALRCGPDDVARGVPPATVSLEHDAERACEAVAEGPGGVPLARLDRAGVRAEPADGPAEAEPAAGPDPLVLGLSIGGGVVALGLVVGLAAGLAGGAPSEALIQLAVEW